MDQLLERPEPKYIGGAERQICTLARLLNRSGKSVAFISYGDSTDEQSADGIQIFCASVEGSGVRFVRFVHPHLSGLWSAMRRADARVYIQMGAGAATGMVGLGVRMLWPFRPRKFYYLIASDTDADMSRLPNRHERWLYRLGLRATSAIFAQTKKQQITLERNMGYSSAVIELPYVSYGTSRPVRRDKDRRNSVIWVGRLIKIKRPDWVLDIAARCPDMQFDIIGPAGPDSEISRSLKSAAESAHNVTLHGRVSEDRLLELFGSAFALCCTSTIEGFPTTFLEAWFFGLPIVTTFDPDNLVASNQLGFVNTTVEGIAASLDALVRDNGTYEEMSKNANEFFVRRYSQEACSPKLLSMLA
jgi:glycosyltransferase involved in cell wall biosynthesis